MYLINVKSMQLEFFHDSRNQTYAILSHRWQDGEVLFQDMQSGTASKRKGYAKLERFCQVAESEGYTYAWCDTCCINKESSAELSESINSMFRWYQNAAVCYAYLYDLTATSVKSVADIESEWFNRCWCLQELLAPKQLIFFNGSWDKLGSRRDLASYVTDKTAIDVRAFGDDLDQFSIAQRMSWAADRKATRGEDIAYSLLGIFGVSMALLYGEGEVHAFERLQDEIMKQSADQSIFVHSSPGDKQRLLAESPADFRESSRIVRSKPLVGEPYALTNIGLSVSLPLYKWSLEVYIALLDCCEEGSDEPVQIFVQMMPETVHLNSQNHSLSARQHFLRIKMAGLAWISENDVDGLPDNSHTPMYLERPVKALVPAPVRNGFFIRRFRGLNDWSMDGQVWAISLNKWYSDRRIVEMPAGVIGTVAIVIWEARAYTGEQPFRVVLRVAFTPDSRPIIQLFGEERVEAILAGESKTRTLSWSTFGPELHDESGSASITTRTALSDVQWIDREYNPRRSGAIVVKPTGRDKPLRYHHTVGVGGLSMNAFCRKMNVDGITTWTLDVIWKFARDAMAEPDPPPLTSGHCDCCEESIRGPRHKCANCADYDLCRFCISDAKRIHNPAHVFNVL